MMIFRIGNIWLCMTIGLIACSAIPAGAARADDGGADVLSRARPEYDARGLHAGTFLLTASATGSFSYTDNVLNAQSNLDDYFYALSPQIGLASDWARHALKLSAESKSHWYDAQSGENRSDWKVAADGRLDIVRGSEITAEIHHIETHEARGTDQTGGDATGDPAEPTALSRTGFSAEVSHEINRVELAAGVSVEQHDYDDTPCVTACVPPVVPAVINNDDRDRTVTDIFAKIAVEATTDTAVFLRGHLTRHDFDAAIDDDGFNRDSEGWGVDGGIEFSMSHLLAGEIFAGYVARHYDDAALSDTAEFAFGAELKWFASMLTTITLDASRTIEDTSIEQSSGYVSTQAELGIDHELLRNLILSGRLGFETADYQEISRNDDILRAALGGRFLINNHLHFDAMWQYVDRSSSEPAFSYGTNLFTFSLTAKL